jgi:hypothetical protein
VLTTTRMSAIGAVVSAVSGWAALTLTEAVFVFAMPHAHPPDLGYVGFFLLLVVVFSLPYFVFWFGLALPAFWLLGAPAAFRWRLLWAVCGAGVFAAAAAAADVLVAGGPSKDQAFEAVLGSIAGATCFGAFAFFNPRSAGRPTGTRAV